MSSTNINNDCINMTEKSNDGNKNIVIIGHGMSGFKTVQELLNLKANDM